MQHPKSVLGNITTSGGSDGHVKLILEVEGENILERKKYNNKAFWGKKHYFITNVTT